ncbi:hypothetical protein BD769DRAFT_1665342 [Suillus cothurnatus]|nr:hypothetical protein BD769DRAFT_1665342 [Suillus cothurnatus]
MPKKRTLPPRGLGGMFQPKSLSDTKKSSSTFTSSASSPLDMPETNKWQLTPDEEELESCEVLDHEVSKDLREDNEESLPDAPRPNAILLPAFQWDTGIPLSIPREPSTQTVPSAQPPTTKVIILEAYIAVNHITDEVIMILLLGTFISAGSDADVWWTGLGALQKATWAKAKAAFLVKWPAIVVAGKMQREYQKDLLELWFKEEEVGE